MLLDLAVILVAAKLAAELCERVNVPAVVGEIVVGILIGPSLLGWIPADSEPIVALAELGVLLLLVQVGMEMDLAELGRVGRASMTVAVIGVAVPFVLGGGRRPRLRRDRQHRPVHRRRAHGNERRHHGAGVR